MLCWPGTRVKPTIERLGGDMPPDSNAKPDTEAMDEDGELTVEALDRAVGGAITSNGSLPKSPSGRPITINSSIT